MVVCSFCDKEAVYEHRYVAGLYFCEGHKFYHVTANHMDKKMSGRIMIKMDEESK
jgi:predicted mannosyl-3-phosphoglycerate phosphatase (HAD superfamily)